MNAKDSLDFIGQSFVNGNLRVRPQLSGYFQNIESALSSPSFEDAVKVVEEMIADYEMEETPQGAIKRHVIYDILTALRERGKGK